jgi:hypothetical protein
MRPFTAVLIVLIMLLPVSAFAWGQKGHSIVNEVAIDLASSKLPPFMNADREHIIFNGYEPDRWRTEGRSPMNLAQELDHQMDLEHWGSFSTLPADRYSFLNQLMARRIDLRIGYLPYAIIENYGRLVNAFRYLRNAKDTKEQQSLRANAVYIAGVLGHYVGDGSQPLHVTIHFNGWADGIPNPKNFTTDRHFHTQYESLYVNAAVDVPRVRGKAHITERLPNVWDSIKQYLSQSFAEIEPVYGMEKSGEFNPEKPSTKGTDFIAAELARASTMLADLWYTAWLESSEPVRTPNAN